MSFRRGDRVRIIDPNSEYTGCRGTIADAETDPPTSVRVLGHEVAIDGENGRSRPFLVDALEPLRAARVGTRSTVGRPGEVDGGPTGR
jgi:hypothetical protein